MATQLSTFFETRFSKLMERMTVFPMIYLLANLLLTGLIIS